MAKHKSNYNNADLYELQKWCDELLEDNPAVSPHKHDIERLLKMKERNEEVEKDAKEMIKMKEDLIKFYNSESEWMKELIKSEGVSLPEQTKKRIELTAEIASKMHLTEPNKTNLLLGLCNLRNKNLEKDGQKLKHNSTLSTLSRKVVEVDSKNNVIRREMESLQTTITIQDARRKKLNQLLTSMAQKRKEYTSAIKAAKESLAAKGFDQSIRHSELVEKDNSVKALEKEVQKVQGELERYLGLPPDIDLVTVKVMEGKVELGKVRDQFESLLKKLEIEDDQQKESDRQELKLNNVVP